MPALTFYLLGNADSAFIELDNGINILIDYAHSSSIDIVAFTHADEDHTRGAAGFFEFDYANKYRSKGRVKINELRVPAATAFPEVVAPNVGWAM